MVNEISEFDENSGRWIASVPLPFYGLFRISCAMPECRKKFRKSTFGFLKYKNHYREEHIK